MLNRTNSNCSNPTVLFVSEHSPWGLLGYQSTLAFSPRITPIFWSAGDSSPDVVDSWTGDWIISFKSDLILEGNLLTRANCGAINFHPGPPKYRGVGGYVWALKNGDAEYGVTCHFMAERVDFGSIIDFEPFAIFPTETVSSLRFRTAVFLLAQLNRLLARLARHEALQPNGLQWSPHLYTYRELRETEK